MKIAMVTAFWGPAYPTGSGVYANELAKILVKKGHEVHIYVSNEGNCESIIDMEGVVKHPLKSHGIYWNMNPMSNVFFKLLQDNYDVVHVHSYIFLISNTAAMARGFKDFQYVLQFHGGINHSFVNSGQTAKLWVKNNIFDRTVGTFTAKMADNVVSVCKSDIPAIRSKFGVEASYLPNAVDITKFKYKSPESRTVTFVGKFERWKGFDTAIDVFKIINKQMKDVNFKVVGKGSLEYLARNSDLPITIDGHIRYENMPEIYRESGVTILPSYMEGAPTTCLESLSCGVPVVATDVGDTKYIVRDGITGFLEEPGNAQQLATRVIQLLKNDDDRIRFGLNGRKMVAKEYCYDSVGDKTVSLYKTQMEDSSRNIG